MGDSTDLSDYFGNVLPAMMQQRTHSLRETVVFDVSGGGGGVWSVDFGKRSVQEGESPAQCTIHVSSADLRELIEAPERGPAFVTSRRIEFASGHGVGMRVLQFLRR